MPRHAMARRPETPGRALQVVRPARIRLDAGETYDVAWTPQRAGDYTLVVTKIGTSIIRQGFRVQ